jgi:hypothetical protein
LYIFQEGYDAFNVYPWMELVIVLQGQMKSTGSVLGGFVAPPAIVFVRDHETVQENTETIVEFNVTIPRFLFVPVYFLDCMYKDVQAVDFHYYSPSSEIGFNISIRSK